jgi:hypothetical protein
MKYIIIILCLLCGSLATAQDCQNIKDSGDGIPAAYFRHKCEGEKAVKAKQYDKAVAEFEQAFSIEFHESPNYELNVDLAEALCQLGRKEEANKIIREFNCMAAVDLRELECYDKEGKPNPKLTTKCFDEMCIIALGLTSEGKSNLLKRRERMKQIEIECE